MLKTNIRKQNNFKVIKNVGKRYTLNELSYNATPKNLTALHKATKSAREGKPVGRELL